MFVAASSSSFPETLFFQVYGEDERLRFVKVSHHNSVTAVKDAIASKVDRRCKAVFFNNAEIDSDTEEDWCQLNNNRDRPLQVELGAHTLVCSAAQSRPCHPTPTLLRCFGPVGCF